MVQKLYGKKNDINSVNQTGGNPLLIKAASDLIVPMALSAGAKWWSSKYGEQSGGQIPLNSILDHPILKLYMKAHDLTDMTPHTLIPAGLIMNLHQLQIPNLVNHNLYQQLIEMVRQKDLDSYLKKNKIKHIDPHTYLPFSILMGPHIFSEYVKEI